MELSRYWECSACKFGNVLVQDGADEPQFVCAMCNNDDGKIDLELVLKQRRCADLQDLFTNKGKKLEFSPQSLTLLSELNEGGLFWLLESNLSNETFGRFLSKLIESFLTAGARSYETNPQLLSGAITLAASMSACLARARLQALEAAFQSLQMQNDYWRLIDLCQRSQNNDLQRARFLAKQRQSTPALHLFKFYSNKIDSQWPFSQDPLRVHCQQWDTTRQQDERKEEHKECKEATDDQEDFWGESEPSSEFEFWKEETYGKPLLCQKERAMFFSKHIPRLPESWMQELRPFLRQEGDYEPLLETAPSHRAAAESFVEILRKQDEEERAPRARATRTTTTGTTTTSRGLSAAAISRVPRILQLHLVDVAVRRGRGGHLQAADGLHGAREHSRFASCPRYNMGEPVFAQAIALLLAKRIRAGTPRPHLSAILCLLPTATTATAATTRRVCCGVP